MIDTSLNSSNFYFLLAVVQGTVLSFIIFFKRPKKRPHTCFAILVFLVSLSLLHLILEESIHAFNARFPIPMEFGFAYGPLAHLHLVYLKDPLRKFKKTDILHFLPSFLLDVVLFVLSFLFIGANMDWAYENIALIQTFALWISFLGIVHLGIYTYLMYKESIDARPVLQEFKEVKKWLHLLITSWALLIGFLMIAIPIGLIFINQLDENSAWFYKSLGAIMAFWIYLLGYLYLTRYIGIIGKYIHKIEKFSFSVNELNEKKNEILHALQGQELYKDPNLTLAKLAGHLGWPINTLSTTINKTLQINFNDLINRNRIAAFKRLTLDPKSKKYSILGLGQEVGFSSKASFYRVFKKETGMTPSEYLKSKV